MSKLSVKELQQFLNDQNEKLTFVLTEVIMDRRKQEDNLVILTIEYNDFIACDWSMIESYDVLDIEDLQKGELSILISEEQDYLLTTIKEDEINSMVILVCEGVIVHSIE